MRVKSVKARVTSGTLITNKRRIPCGRPVSTPNTTFVVLTADRVARVDGPVNVRLADGDDIVIAAVIVQPLTGTWWVPLLRPLADNAHQSSAVVICMTIKRRSKKTSFL